MSAVLNRGRAEAVLSEAGVDVVVATTHQNVFYTTGYVGFGQRLMPATQVYAVSRADALDQPVLIAPMSDLDVHAQLPAPLARLRPYGRFFVEIEDEGAELDPEQERYRAIALQDPAESALEALLDELARLPSRARIALDERGIAAAAREAVLQRFGRRVVDGASLLDRIRMVKTPEEVRRLTAAALTVEESYLTALRSLREGMSEEGLARLFDGRTVEQGGQPCFTVIAFGERGALPNALPSRWRRLGRGDLIRFDVGCRTEMYCSDIARTAVFGEPSRRLRERYEAILLGEERMLEVLGPGITAREVFEAAVRATREAGIGGYRRHHVGHGVGLDTYDPPLLGPTTETVLEPGMVLEIETPYYELGFGGVQVEDTVLITETGCRLLTRSSRRLAVVT
ncbi:MAG TPA: Xaa-Pro peptidase family protein [Candidatus Dormibacteraeota bacterium]|nr:Xaa-Pro peptidase family protein [Candidatus Dormibacteraeota bacterium]